MWAAEWISFAYDPRQDLGVFAFRRPFTLDDPDIRLPIRASADNRYKLYCNGRLVGTGPQRGDERHWFYETYDLAPYLQAGENELVAVVWNFGWMAPMAQHTVRMGFILEDLREGGNLSTRGEWKVARVPGWDFDMMHSSVGGFYIDVGPGEIIHGTGVAASTDLALNLAAMEWREPHSICRGEHRGDNGGGTQWMTIPGTLPPQRYQCRAEPPVARTGSGSVDGGFEVSAGSPLILDFGELLCAYPRLSVKGPKGTTLALTYAEAPWVVGKNEKGNRNEIEGKEIRGYQDKFILSGGKDVFEPLWWRTFRYVEISAVEPHEGGGCIVPPFREAISFTFETYETGYPYDIESSFEADDPWAKPIWDVSVRTAERCAGETYFDCPYYEQLQYVGDSRIQALIGYYLGRDRRLQRNCIEQIGWSIMENGLTQSRYPSRQTQVIPPFSLWWVMMLYDQWLYDSAERFEEDRTIGADTTVLVAWTRMQARGLPAQYGEGPVRSFWQFGDWVPTWAWGVPPGGVNSTMHALLEALASLSSHSCLSDPDEDGVELEDLTGLHSERFRSLFTFDNGLIKYAFDRSWQPSEHAEALYRCAQMVAGEPVSDWPSEALEAANAAKCTFYFSYYKHLAIMSAALATPSNSIQSHPTHPNYMDLLAPWKEQIENGLTTFAENPEPTRSDCHAWSAHPILGFFQMVAGATSIGPGWSRARIAPQPGSLKRFDARIAHPKGELRVTFENGKLLIDTPVPASLHWHGKDQELEPGEHRIG